MKVVYHAAPRDMVGSTLYPLHRLKAIAPDAYELQKSKYAGRESVLDYRIPGLDVLLNDTLHCAALSPARLFDERVRLGLPVPRTDAATMMTELFFAIPLERILQHRVVWYSGKTMWINGAPGEDVPMTPPPEEFEPFDPDRYEELAAPTPAHLAYLRRVKDAGGRPLMFVHIPHILVAGPVDVSGLDPIRWEDVTREHRPSRP